MAQHAGGGRTLRRPIVWVCIVLVLAAIPVQATGSGIDLFALLVSASVLFILERTLGDGVAELVGPLGAALLFTGLAAIGVVYMLTQSGQGHARQMLAAAEARGYQPLYFTSDRTKNLDEPQDEKRKDKTNKTDRAADSTGEKAFSAGQGGVTAVLPPPDNAPIPEGSKVVVSTPFWASRGAERPIALFHVKPEYATAGEPVSLEVTFVGPPLTERGGTFAFAIEGRIVGTVPADERGGATFTFVPKIPGTYRVAVRLPASTRAASPADATLVVLPPRR